MKPRIVILGAGFGGMGLSTLLSEEVPDEADVTLIDRSYAFAATPGLTQADEFYSEAGAAGLRSRIADFSSGSAVIGVCAAPYKCPPAPSECALLLHDSLVRRGVRDRCEITLVLPFARPNPPSPDTSAALVSAFAERDIALVPS